MIKKALTKALLAELYIVVIVSVIQYTEKMTELPETILIPMVMLSLFVISAAVMAYLFVAEPILLYIDGQKKQAVNLFLFTVGMFALITFLISLTLFFLF